MQKLETATDHDPGAVYWRKCPYRYEYPVTNHSNDKVLWKCKTLKCNCIMYLASVQKSVSFGEEVNDRVRYIVVCAYRNGGSSRLSRGRLGNQTDYVLSVDLESIYPPTKPTGEDWENYEPSDFWQVDRRTKETTFDAEKALSDFMSTFGGLEDDTLKGVDVPISEIDDDGNTEYEVSATGNTKAAYHFAVDVSEPYETTKAAAKRALEKHLENGTLIPIETKPQK